MSPLLRHLFCTTGLALSCLVSAASAQPRVTIEPAAFRFDPSGPVQQTFQVHIRDYAGLDGYSIPIFYDPAVVRVVSTSRRGELIDNAGGQSLCLTTFSNALRGILQVDCSNLDRTGTGYTGSDAVAFAVTLERVGTGTTVLTVNDNYYNYSQDLRLRDKSNMPIMGATVQGATVSVNRPLPAAAAMRTLLDFETANRDSSETAFAPVGTTSARHRVRNNGDGGRLTIARYDTQPPGGNTAPYTDPDGTLHAFATPGRYWELTSSFAGAYLQDVAFSYAGVVVNAPARLRLARRVLDADGTVTWQVVPAARTSVNTAASEVQLLSVTASDVESGQYTIVTEPDAVASATTTVATAGWRVLAPPLGALTVGTLAGINLVQGVSDEFAAFNPNLFTGYSGNENAVYRGYTLPSAKSDALTPGRGFLWYFFADGGPEAGDARGTSRRAALPLTLAANGSALVASTSVTFTAPERSGATTDFYMLGNPFAQGFSLSGVSVTSGTLSNIFQIWNGSSWITRDRLAAGSSDVAVWQGFFAEITGPSFPLTVSYDYGAVTGTSPVLIGKGGPALARLGLRLSGTAPGGADISDEAAALVVRDQASLGWDADDASKLDPLSGAGFTVGVVGDKGGASVVQAQRSVPETLAGPLEVPLRLTVPAPARLRLSWSGAATLPPSWGVSLVDRRTGATVEMRADTAYAFDATAADAGRLALVLRLGGATGVDTPGGALASEALVVSAPYPQPARAWVRMSVAVGAPQRVVVEVYDVLGRRVSVTALEGLAAGQEQTVTLDVSALPSGTYLVRVSGADDSVTRRLTVAR